MALVLDGETSESAVLAALEGWPSLALSRYTGATPTESLLTTRRVLEPRRSTASARYHAASVTSSMAPSDGRNRERSASTRPTAMNAYQDTIQPHP